MKKLLALASLFGGVLLLWVGMVIAISFMEAHLKFTAPGITVQLGLGIGRIVFAALQRAELALALLSLLLAIWVWPRPRVRWPWLLALAVLATQWLWLMPALDARAELILAGTPPPNSYHHWLYIGLDLLKVLSLLAAAVIQAFSLHRYGPTTG